MVSCVSRPGRCRPAGSPRHKEGDRRLTKLLHATDWRPPSTPYFLTPDPAARSVIAMTLADQVLVFLSLSDSFLPSVGLAAPAVNVSRTVARAGCDPLEKRNT